MNAALLWITLSRRKELTGLKLPGKPSAARHADDGRGRSGIGLLAA